MGALPRRSKPSRAVALAALAALPAIVLAGCVDRAADEVVAASEEVPSPLGPLVELVADAAGDAYEGADVARDTARFGLVLGCIFGGLVVERAGVPFERECFNLTRPSEFGEGAPRVGRAADPALDVLSVAVASSADTLVVELETAQISDGLGWVRPDSSTIHQVCWDSREPWMFERALCDRGVVLWVQTPTNGTPAVLFSAYVDRREDCTSDWYSVGGCIFPVEHTLEVGSPGRIRWSVPRAWLGNATELAAPFALTQVGTLRDWQLQPFFSCICLRDPGDDFPAVVDASATGTVHPLPPRSARDPAAPPGTPGIDGAGDWLGAGGSADIDVLSTVLREGPDNLTLSIELASVPEAPPRAAVFGHFGLPGRSYWVALRTYDDEVALRAVACAGRREDGWCAKYSDIPVQVARLPGTPGKLEFTLARSDLGFPVAGELVHSIWSLAHAIDLQQDTPPQLAQLDITLRAQDVPSIDFGALAPATRIRSGEPPRTLDGAPESVTIADDSFDYGNANVCFFENCNRFDVTYVELAAVGPTSTDVTIGIADLSRVSVPIDYHAVVYAVGVRTADAQAMVGYARDEDSEDTFFCGPDNLVLVGTPLDPSSVASTPITGLVTLGERAQGVRADSAAPGSITIHVPDECFGKREAGPLHVEAFGAGTYAVSNPTKRAGEGSVETIDSAAQAEPFTIAAVAPPLPPPLPWYARDIFWNAFGAFLAVLTVGFTVAVYYRRRRLMQWYLQELTRIDRDHQEDAIRRAKAILALRRRLHNDIIRHRVSDSEYIRDRIRGSLTSARLVSLSEDYFDLPAPLTLRIERVLDDGRMTAEEGKLVERAMARVKLPDEARGMLVERIRAWVEEDASWG